MQRNQPGAPRSRQESGFSLLELVIALAVMVEVLVVVLILFDVNNRMTRIQTQITDMQQSLRVGQYDMVRLVRMAGRGSIPQAFAVQIRANVGPNAYIAAGDNKTPKVLEDTDVLTIRGVFSSPIYQINFIDDDSLQLSPNDDDAASARSGKLIIDSRTANNIPQPLEALKELGNNPLPEALVLVSPVDDSIYAVVEISKILISSLGDLNGDGVDEERAAVDFQIQSGTHIANYLALSAGGGYPGNLSSVAFAGILEEYRFYIREDRAIEGDTASDLTPKLSRARFFPGTEVLYGANASEQTANARADIADNIVDLQIALALDVNGNGQIDDGGGDTKADDWLYNDKGDRDIDPQWATARLFYVRLNTLARTDRKQPNYEAPLLGEIEDRDYASDPMDQGEERKYRRRFLRTVVDMRNVG